MIKKTLRRVGRMLAGPVPAAAQDQKCAGISATDLHIIECVRPYTMTSLLRIQACIEATRYCVRRGVPGAFVECGVWRGGSVLAMILTFKELGVSDRDIWLYDTFEGMTAPTEHDVSPFEAPALKTWQESQNQQTRAWDFFFRPEVFNEEMVRKMLLSTGYPAERLHFVKGSVEQTLPQQSPDKLALLRLDTDWYESTRHELEHLYPLLSDGGVLIIDDYGHWEGCRRAVDEYFSTGTARPVLLNRIDYTGRIAIK